MSIANYPCSFYGNLSYISNILFREEYLKLGGSPHNLMRQVMRDSLEQFFRTEGDTCTRFYTAFLDSNPRPDETMIGAANAGTRRIVTANAFLTISSHTEAGQELANWLEMEKCGIPVLYTEPLWISPELKQKFVERAAS